MTYWRNVEDQDINAVFVHDSLESEQERNYRKKQEAIRDAEIKNQQERDRKLREMYGILTKEHNKVDGEL